MQLPTVDQPERYRGLYVFDFGAWTALGYTVEEVAALLESEAYRDAKVYKIVRASPTGQFELKGVSAERFQLEAGLFFNRNELVDARADYHELADLAARGGLPCRAFLHLADRGPREGVPRYAAALIYPAEYDDEIAAWLLTEGFEGGDWVEGGVSAVTDYYGHQHTILERTQLWSRSAIPSRSREDLIASIRTAVQR